jgi:YidC/Oxa1 family membrane protein insertase
MNFQGPQQDDPLIDRRMIAALVLSVVVLIGWQWLFPPAATPPPATENPLAAQPSEPVSPPVAQEGEQQPRMGEEMPAAEDEQAAVEELASDSIEAIRIETDLVEVVFTNEGGRVTSWKLKNFTGDGGRYADLVSAGARRTGELPLGLTSGDPVLDQAINEALFLVERQRLEGGGGERITFRWADGMGVFVEKAFTFRERSYLVEVVARVVDRGRDRPVALSWGAGLQSDDHDGGGYIHYTGQAVVRQPGGSAERVKPDDLDAPIQFAGDASPGWAGLEEQYFAALIIPDGPRGPVTIRSVRIPGGAEGTDDEEPEYVVSVGMPEGSGKLFVGPKEFRLLLSYGYGLDEVVWFSSNALIYAIAKYLFLALVWIHDRVISNYGLAIILATVALRLVLFPLNQFSMVRMRRTAQQMQRIQPKIKAIQAKYKKSKDPQSRVKMNEETMALYRKEGVNPLGGVTGCLPLLAQFPILIAFYNVLTVAVELKGAPFFGWIQDLTMKDPFYVTPILMGVTMFTQQKMTPAAGADPMQQRMMLMMPIIFTVMFLNLPSGLVIYWFVNNLLGIAQQWLVNRHVARTEALAVKGA